MPIITALNISNFRNLATVSFCCSPHFNVFYGNNGAGKTSILEAIYYLGLAKSFRNTNPDKIIRHTEECLTVVANLDGNNQIAGISYHANKTRQIRLNGEEQSSIAHVTQCLPMQFMSPMSYRFFHDGPKVRRQYLDWALFHVEHDFFHVWRTLQRVLKQRNSALKQQQETAIWDATLIEVSERIDQQRQQIVKAVTPLCKQQLQSLLPGNSFQLRYQRGWPIDVSLAEVFMANKSRDQQLGYTYYGPQRADFQLLLDNKPVQDVLSQGQQKLAAYALHLSLGALLQQQSSVRPIYLIDDLPSELDTHSREKITESLLTLNAQTFISGIDAADLKHLRALSQTQMFHVEQGIVAVKDAVCAV